MFYDGRCQWSASESFLSHIPYLLPFFLASSRLGCLWTQTSAPFALNQTRYLAGQRYSLTTGRTRVQTPLPTPSEIRSSSSGHNSRKLNDESYDGNYWQQVEHYPDLGLVVKYGRRTTVAEGQALWMIRQYCLDVPVPEVYGWIQDGEETFIYLSYINGVTLCSRLHELTDEEIDQVAGELATMIRSWRRLRLPEGDVFVGKTISELRTETTNPYRCRCPRSRAYPRSTLVECERRTSFICISVCEGIQRRLSVSGQWTSSLS